MGNRQAGNPFHGGDSDEASEYHATSSSGSSVNSAASNVTNLTQRWLMENCEKKRLFICCDGTWQNASSTISPLSNVAKLARAVTRLGEDTYKHADPTEVNTVHARAQSDPQSVYNFDPNDKKARAGLVRQLVYYSSGIGGQTALAVERGYSGLTSKGLETNIFNAYCFICNNYNFPSNKDEIILAGFSRGAFAVRCLANFIDKVGLLRRKGLPFLRPLFDSWKRWGRADGQKKEKLKSEFQQRLDALEDLREPKVPVRILAEWDTVSAIGLPLSLWRDEFSFVNEEVPECVEHAFLALALDEKRRSLKPRQWRAKAKSETIVEQCAFVGCHSDIGGGNADMGLSTITLIWMMSNIREHSDAAFDERTMLQFMFPNQQNRKVSWGTPKMELKNSAGTAGLIHESLRGWWRVPWALSFELWHGKRGKIFHKDDDDEFKVKVHFTVRVIGKKSRCRLNEEYVYEHMSESWVSKANSEMVLQEAEIMGPEHRRYKAWIRIANHFQERERNHMDLEDIDEDVNWTQVARHLGWKKPVGEMEDDAIVTLVAPEINRLEWLWCD
ncbi:hypothetical protein CcaCcLH18_05508 [Colletotrichum camelliae]|nr:hypothetical protein CcaCcLH18_05508 [Colletotrichum camelliae]